VEIRFPSALPSLGFSADRIIFGSFSSCPFFHPGIFGPSLSVCSISVVCRSVDCWRVGLTLFFSRPSVHPRRTPTSFIAPALSGDPSDCTRASFGVQSNLFLARNPVFVVPGLQDTPAIGFFGRHRKNLLVVFGLQQIYWFSRTSLRGKR
jgi:hypothetical protein